MKISEMIKNLQVFMDEYGDIDCWYAVDDEGNEYHEVYYDPTLYGINIYGEIYSWGEIKERDLDDIDNDIIKICVIN